MTKIERYLQTIPSIYNTASGSFLRALLDAWAQEDESIVVQIDQAHDQLFMILASDKYLDAIGSNVGVSRPAEINLSDENYRKLVPVASFYPKQVRQTMYEVLDVFWGPLYSRANLTTNVSEPYNLGAVTTLTGALTFNAQRTSVSGSGTLFTIELSVGDWIKASSDPNTAFSRVARIIDNQTLILSTAYPNYAVGSSLRYQALSIDLKMDVNAALSIALEPTFFSDTTSVSATELAIALNSLIGTQLTASIIDNPLTGVTYLNVRTNTIGALGSIHVIGGSANAILSFSTNEVTIGDMPQKTVLYEINPRELVVRLPNVVPALRRTLKGGQHFHSNYSGTIVSIDNLAKTVTVNFYDAVTANWHAGNTLSQNLAEAEIVSHLAGQNGVVLQFAATTNLSAFTASYGFAILDKQEYGFIGSFMYDPVNALYTVSNLGTTLNQVITAGSVYPVISVQDSSRVPDTSGYLIFDLGNANEEQPIRYRSRPNNSTLLLDPAYSFTKNHAVGANISVLRTTTSTTPRINGSDYAVYVVGTAEARLVVQELLRKIKAAGVVLRFIIDFPQYLWTQCI